MPYVPLTRFLFRAPLLPVRALRDAKAQALAKSALGSAALQLASPDLAAALAEKRGDASANAALERYARRAAFRPTPNGFWAGVGVGRLGARPHVRTPAPLGVLSISWQRLATLGRALLDDPEVRMRVCLRRAPSLVVGARTLLWLAAGGGGDDDHQRFCEERVTDKDDVLSTLVEVCAEWSEWQVVRRTVAAGMGMGADTDESDDEIDDWLLTLIDDGLLHVDVVPPLVGAEPGAWMAERLARLPEAREVAARFAAVRALARGGDPRQTAAALAALPGPRPGASKATAELRGTLVFPGSAPVTLSKAVVERAAGLAPLLFRLQEALVPPTAERDPSPAFAEALEAATEILGAGAFELGALALGDYGASPTPEPGDHAQTRERPAAPAALMTFLLDAIVAAGRDKRAELSLRSQDLEPLLDEVPLPPTCELFLTPARAGHGWLLGLHAPAGASWGRFANALGNDAWPLFDDLRDAESRAQPDQLPLDVVFTPNARLADLCTHPPQRSHALALSGWPDAGQAAVTLAELELVADPAALDPLALRVRDLGPVGPSPLHRVRSTTAPPGIWQSLVGWNLRRQHAPWALSWGALGNLAVLPRVSIDGFVVAPASWRIPDDVRSGSATTRALGAWRREGHIPRFVQVGAEDELLPVDLSSPEARAELKGHARAFEIWPPLSDTPDQSGRRLEAVIALVSAPDTEERAFDRAAAAATMAAGSISPPGRAPDGDAGRSWHTFKLFGAADRQDLVLLDVVGPAVAEAGTAGEITGWFFQRYVEGPGNRPHLRVRVERKSRGDASAFRRRLHSRIVSTLLPGDVVSLDATPYFPETARFGGEASLPGVHRLFQAGSELALAQLARELDADDDQLDARLIALVAAYDTVATSFGLDAQARRALAERRRQAHASDVDPDFERELAREFRAYRPALRAALADLGVDEPTTPDLAAYAAATQAAAALLHAGARALVLPALLHLDAVRLVGPDRATEIRALTFWERTLESLQRHPESRR